MTSFKFSREKKPSFFSDTKLIIVQMKRKKAAYFKKPLFISKTNYFKSQNDHKLSSKKLDTVILNSLGSQLDL